MHSAHVVIMLKREKDSLSIILNKFFPQLSLGIPRFFFLIIISVSRSP
jgi:hypothetical protein